MCCEHMEDPKKGSQKEKSGQGKSKLGRMELKLEQRQPEDIIENIIHTCIEENHTDTLGRGKSNG